MPVKGSIVMTTIFDPVILETYFQNLQQFDHLGETEVFLIPDRKTPRSAYDRCCSLRERGLRVTCPSLEEQDSFLKRIGLPADMIPYNSDNRRNVGYLMALERGAEFVISVDDDNYPRADEDFFGEHAVVCRGEISAKVVQSDTGWFNICSSLKFDRPGPAYPRGFPYFARHKEENPSLKEDRVRIHMNAGLWLSDPDMDGLSWMVNPVRATEFSGESVVLGTSAWSPVNSQNTALRRDVMPSYYFVRMGYSLGGLTIDRYGDIFSGYFAQACVLHLGGSIRVGTPIADHRRNSHNYVKDALNEWACIVALEELLMWLAGEARLSGNCYCDAYVSLSHEMESAVERFQGLLWTAETRAYFHEIARYMQEWAAACRRLGS